jgi:hypothetical protein
MARKRSENDAVVSNGGASAKLLIANTTSASRKKHSVSRANAKSAITERENPAPEVAAAEGPSREEIARLAYSYWEARGYQGGSAEEDWLRAEQELDARESSAAVPV